MNVLVIHPEDDLQGEPWAAMRWDRVVDLGASGAESYARAAADFGCTIANLNDFGENIKELRRVRELMTLGMGRLTDSFALDWWELNAMLVHPQLEAACRLKRLVEEIRPDGEVYVSRPCFEADFLHLALGTRLHTFAPASGRRRGRLRRYLRAFGKFPLPQLLEIFWDKTDLGYQIRGTFSRRAKPQSSAVVLLPSCYVNVSRTAAAYAECLPDVRFLLVLTRRSGRLENLPANVTSTWLRRYASLRLRSRKKEWLDLVQRWGNLRNELMAAAPEIRALAELQCFDEFPEWLARGLEIRDAWRNVIDSEPVQAVICADDSNPYTHLPLLLAKHKGLPALACHHGALCGLLLFKRSHADVLLAKGEMERDYLVNLCGIASRAVEIGAPMLPLHLRGESSRNDRSCIVFFSEPYEIQGRRVRAFYQDILPRLADLALSEKRKLVIKLHPSESFSERNQLVGEVLRPGQRSVTQLVGGALQAELMDRAWFGVTVVSTVAVECALRGIPCFLCAWLGAFSYGYADQFARFGVGIRLNHPQDIGNIPVILQSYKASSGTRENCWSRIEPSRLQALLGMQREVAAGEEASKRVFR